jgi:hypothetical protein
MLPSNEGYTKQPDDITRHPVLRKAQEALARWYAEIGSSLITYDLDGEYPRYLVASSSDASQVAIVARGGDIWLMSAGGSNSRRLQVSFDPKSGREVDDQPSDDEVLVAMDPGGAWLAALGPYDSWMQRLVFIDLQSGRRLLDRPVSRSTTLDAVQGGRGVWLSDARQISLTPKLDSQTLFDTACARRPDGRRSLTAQALGELGLKAHDSDPCRRRFVLSHLLGDLF